MYDFIKVQSAHQKNLQRFMTEQITLKGITKENVRFCILLVVTVVLGTQFLCMMIPFQPRSMETHSH